MLPVYAVKRQFCDSATLEVTNIRVVYLTVQQSSRTQLENRLPANLFHH